MATRKKRPWNADLRIYPEDGGQLPHEVPEHLRKLDERVSVGHSTPGGPESEKTQPAPEPSEQE